MLNEISMKLNADRLIQMALREDISWEDVSTNAVMPQAKAGAVDLICKQDGIIAGLPVYARVFQLLDPETVVEFHCQDGDPVKKGQLLAVVRGDIRVLLSGERVALNYLQRMSGIASYTHAVAQLLSGSKTTLLDTRKTTPNCRIFEKYAVRIGGGSNHRYNLSDGVMLKDNHINAAGGISQAIRMAKDYAPFVRKIEVETETLEQVQEAVEAGADIILEGRRIGKENLAAMAERDHGESHRPHRRPGGDRVLRERHQGKHCAAGGPGGGLHLQRCPDPLRPHLGHLHEEPAR